jgi:hypothetical protein
VGVLLDDLEVLMEDIDCYVRLCMRQYAAQQDLDEYWRDRLLKTANLKPKLYTGLQVPLHWLGLVLMRLEKWLTWAPSHFPE